MRKVGFIIFVICASPSCAASISKFDSKLPSIQGYSEAGIFDIERCFINMDRMSVPYVYRQPDRPDDVMLIWQGTPGLTKARVDLKRVGNRTFVKAWMDNDAARECASILAPEK